MIYILNHLIIYYRSNGLPLPESDGFGMAIAMATHLEPSQDLTVKPSVLMGTIAKACLSPGKSFGMSILNTSASAAFDIRPYRPRKVLFQTSGEMEMLRPDLKKLGITKVGVAEQALVRSMELHNSQINDVHQADIINPLVNTGPAALGQNLLAQAEVMSDPYVREPEEPYDLGGWTPPNKRGDLPARWYAQPPDDINSWRPSALLGWRTNLERAVLREDTTKVKDIVRVRDAKDIREFVECRMLLTKCAQRGLLVACKLLIEECGASVEGAQAPDSEPWWLAVQDSSGNCDSLTPLHQAARNGQTESIRLLLDYGAEINRIDRGVTRGSTLHHAVSGGQVDCVRLLCERGVDHEYGEFSPVLSALLCTIPRK